MNDQQIKALDKRLGDFVNHVTADMGRSERRQWAEVYLRGLLLDGERKSIEPMALRVGGDVQALQQFVGQSPWAAEKVMDALNKHMTSAVAEGTYWIIDETSFPKAGQHSVGVARQYCGALGKIANCQVAVTLHRSNEETSWPMGWKLYLPENWISDIELRKEAGIPEEISYQTKPALALALIDQVMSQAITPGIVLADQGYGAGFAWRAEVHERELSYCLAVGDDTGVWQQAAPKETLPYSGAGRPRKHPPRCEVVSLQQIAMNLPKRAWRKITWRMGTKGKQTSRFACLEVCAANRSKGNATRARWTEFALIEWPSSEPLPTKYWLCWFRDDPSPDLLKLVRNAKARWRIEKDYRELKEELGLDHFEGRGWLGWHHHVTLVTLAFAFLRLEQLRFKKNSWCYFADDPQASSPDPDPA